MLAFKVGIALGRNVMYLDRAQVCGPMEMVGPTRCEVMELQASHAALVPHESPAPSPTTAPETPNVTVAPGVSLSSCM